MKYFHFAVTVQENGKYYSYVLKISPADNVIARLNVPGIIQANACESKKRAEALAEHWNACHRANGRYIFDTPAF